MMPLTYAASKIADREADRRGRNLLEDVGLGDRMHHEPSQMSGGQQQRVAIARSLVNQPPLLLADEPTGNLDSHTSEEILRMFQTLNASGITIILVTHDVAVAQRAQRIIRIRDGRIEDDGTRPAGRAPGPTAVPMRESKPVSSIALTKTRAAPRRPQSPREAALPGGPPFWLRPKHNSPRGTRTVPRPKTALRMLEPAYRPATFCPERSPWL